MAIRILRDNETNEPSPTSFYMVLIGLTGVICFNIAKLIYRYFKVVHEEHLDQHSKKTDSQPMEVWYMEEAMRKEQARRRRKRKL